MEHVKIDFHDALQRLLAEHREYHPDAYQFLYRAAVPGGVPATVPGTPAAHLSASEFYTTFCQSLLSEYGPMALTVFHYWGLTTAQDVGTAVYHLIEAGVVSKRKHESRSDFDHLPTPEQMLAAPFEPAPEV